MISSLRLSILLWKKLSRAMFAIFGSRRDYGDSHRVSGEIEAGDSVRRAVKICRRICDLSMYCKRRRKLSDDAPEFVFSYVIILAPEVCPPLCLAQFVRSKLARIMFVICRERQVNHRTLITLTKYLSPGH